MSLSRDQLAGKLSKKALSLDEKTLLKAIQTLDVENLQKYLKSEKTAAANILQEEKSIRSQHELFREKSKKRNRPGKYQKINDILYL